MPDIDRSILSRRALAVEESATLAVSDRAARMKAEGIDVISFGAGEPDFDTPDFIKKAAIDALGRGLTKYTASSGILPLRKAVAAKFKRDNRLSYEPDRVLISCGAKHAIFNAMHATLDEGDEVIIPSPYWTSYPEMVKTTGATPVIVPTREADGFKITAAALDKAITPRTKLLVHCSPSNPTGMVYTEPETRAIADVVVRRGIHVISDEVYESMIYGGTPHVTIAGLGRDIFDRTIVVNSCSKTYAMTGWRVGYAAGPRDIIQGMGRIQGQATSNPNSIAQYAVLAALESDQSCIAPMVKEYGKRRDFIVDRLKKMAGVALVKPDGAFFVFPRMDAWYGKKHKGAAIDGSAALCGLLLDEAHIALVPGAAFGSDAHVRISYATSMEKIAEGMNRLEAFLSKLT